jgi:Reverse transcriptase (RNA-dependent DNA polymerase)
LQRRSQVADYAVAHGINSEPAFAWWVPYTLKRRNRIIAAVNNRFRKRTHKFGIEVPKTWDDCVRIDAENGNTLWQDAVRKEMSKVRVAFQVMGDDDSPPPTYQEIRCHLVFDVKMENFQRKARLVAGGHMTETPASITYASVVSRESVRIALTLAALNDLEVKTADIENAYLTAPVGEKIWCRLGPEFGGDSGKRALVVRALYGLKSAGASFRNHLADCMRHLGWTSCIADPDVWLKPEIRPSDGHKYYAYCLLYVDDILVVHHEAIRSLNEIDHFFKTKEGSMRDPEFYLGAKLRQTTLPNGVHSWSMSSSKYIQAAVANVKQYHRLHFPSHQWAKRTSGPFPINYAPELDTTPELDAGHSTFYQCLQPLQTFAVSR